MREEVTRRERIYAGNVVTLDVFDVTYPDGESGKREIVQHPGAVAVVALDSDGSVMLVRQYRTAADQIMLEIPAGTLEPDEPPFDTAARELQEEAGYKPGKLEHIGGIYAAPGYTTEYIHLFLASDLEASTLPSDDDEFIEVVRMPLQRALELVDSGDICDSKTVAGLLRADRHLSRSRSAG